MHTSFDWMSVWTQGDAISHLILLGLLAMSVLSWVVMVFKGWSLWRHRQSALQSEHPSNPANVSHGLFAHLAWVGEQAEACHLGPPNSGHERMDRGDWIAHCLRLAIEEQAQGLQSGLAVLASIGSTAPFLGLLGTVWGIYHALARIGLQGNASLGTVAGPIGETLLMTALGLAVAIPAVLGYNALVRGQHFIVNHLKRFAHEWHAYRLTGMRLTPPGYSAA